MLEGPFALALAAGMVATVNPCGFALLPAYLSAFVGLDDGSAGRSAAVTRALAVSVVLTAGFVTVFGLFGLAVSPLSLRLERYLPWASIVVGAVLVVLGVAMLLGKQITVNLPKLNRGGADGTLASMYLFGVSYAVASLSCAFVPFLGVTTAAFRSANFVSGLLVFVLYGVGMGIVIGVLTVGVALARDGLVAGFRSALPLMSRVAGGLLVLAGAYVAHYGWYQLRLLRGPGVDDPIVDFASRFQRPLAGLMPHTGNVVWYVLIGAALLVAAGVFAHRQREQRERRLDHGT